MNGSANGSRAGRTSSSIEEVRRILYEHAESTRTPCRRVRRSAIRAVAGGAIGGVRRHGESCQSPESEVR